MSIVRMDLCMTCGGTGRILIGVDHRGNETWAICPTCGGSGRQPGTQSRRREPTP